MTKKERALLAVQTLEEVYPQATCALQYEKPYELLIAVRLSAQCTDAGSPDHAKAVRGVSRWNLWRRRILPTWKISSVPAAFFT
ncbi:MAG: hypothetical protein ACLVK8_02010 [Ruminococcus sp.]